MITYTVVHRRFHQKKRYYIGVSPWHMTTLLDIYRQKLLNTNKESKKKKKKKK